ncbi:MAG: hypothetical protein SFU85_05995 [Candidatus Methylacidiphilales bacterium]|nr:hypothetical protein [Candidatus Methylacidiphilales bacterium]
MVFFLFILTVFGIVAWWKGRSLREEVEQLKHKVEDLRIELKELRQGGLPPMIHKPTPQERPTPAPVQTKVWTPPVPETHWPHDPDPTATPPPQSAEAQASLTPPLPTSSEQPAKKFVPQWERTEEPSPPSGPSASFEPYDWAGLFRRLHLLPPEKEWTEAGLAGWWTTRVGILLGIIAAVFFAVYVSHQSPPWVRWVELLAVALGVSYWGFRLTRPKDETAETTKGYGEVVLGGGLAMLYFSAFAAYALAPVRIVESPMAGVLLQIFAAMGFFALAWAARLRVAGTFSILGGLLAIGFAQYHGFHGFALLATVLLAAAGPGLLLGRGWILPALISLVGTYILGGTLILSGKAQSALLFSTWLAVVWFIHVAAPWRGHARGNWPFNRILDRFWTTANTSGVLALAWLFSHHAGDTYFKPFALVASIIALSAAYVLRRRMPDPYFEANYYLKGSFLFTTWLLLTLEGPARWVSLALQSASLLFSWWRQSGRVREFAFLAIWSLAWVWALMAMIWRLGDSLFPAWSGEIARHAFLLTALATAALYHRRKVGINPATRDVSWNLSWPATGIFLVGLLGAITGTSYLRGETSLAFGVVTLVLMGGVVLATRAPLAWAAPALVLIAATVRFVFGDFNQAYAHPGELGLIHGGLWGLLACGVYLAPASRIEPTRRFLALYLSFGIALACGLLGSARSLFLEHPQEYPVVLAATWGVLVTALTQLLGLAAPAIKRRGVSPWSLAAGGAVFSLLCISTGGLVIPAITLGWMALAGSLATVSGSREPRTLWWTFGLAAMGWLHIVFLSNDYNPGKASATLSALLSLLWALGAWRVRPLGGSSRESLVYWLMAAVAAVFLCFQHMPAPCAFTVLALGAAGLAFASQRESLRELRGIWPLLGMAGWLHLAVFLGLPHLPQHALSWWLAAVAVMGLLAIEARFRDAADPILLRIWNQSWAALAGACIWFYVGSWAPPEPWRPAVLVVGAVLLVCASWAFASLPAGIMAVLVWVGAALIVLLIRDAGLDAQPFWISAVLVAVAGLFQGYALKRSHPESTPTFSHWFHAVAPAGLIMILAITPNLGVDAYGTVLWAVAGVVVLAFGFAARLKPYRLTGLALLALGIVRLFFHDLDNTFHRIIASAALAVLLVGIGFSYNRFRRWLE